jgi:hypothetical protein
MPYEFYSYEGLSHYFSTSAENATTQQMFQDSLACLRGFLPGKMRPIKHVSEKPLLWKPHRIAPICLLFGK